MRGVTGWILIAILAALVVLIAMNVVGAPGPSAPDRDVWGLLEKLAGPALGALVAIIGLIFTLRWNAQSMRLTYFTKEWSTLLQFLQQRAKFMDPDRTRDYRHEFLAAEKMEYELVARLCIGYVDDLYFLRSYQWHSWFRGSVKLLVGTHRAWLEDHQEYYDKEFYNFVVLELDGP
jgi:hypothetical protein